MGRKLKVLYVEDEENDRILFSLAVEHAHAPILLQSVSDGSAAIDYLEGIGLYADRTKHPLPELILLDLRMPRMDGFEFLTWKRTSRFSALPVVVFEGSRSKGDQRQALETGAVLALSKPVCVDDLRWVVTEVCALGLERRVQIARPAGMRILLRQAEDQQYLQPSGEWNANRQTARTFPGSVFAYYWAKEKQLLGIEVLLAFEDARRDIVCMRV